MLSRVEAKEDDSKNNSALEKFLGMTKEQFFAASVQEQIPVIVALVKLFGPWDGTLAAVGQVLKNPLITSLLSRLGAILKSGLFNACKTLFDKKTAQTQVLHQLVYYTLAHDTNTGAIEFKDDYVKQAFLQRAAHMVNLEVIYLNNFQQIVALLMEGMTDHLGILLEALASKVSDNPAYLLEYLTNTLTIYDYLPENKFLALFIHPQELWDNGDYAKYKAESTLDFIKNRFNETYKTLNINTTIIEQLSELTCKIRQEMIKIYDVMAENDRQTIQYCKDKKYDSDELFAVNKSLITTLMTNCQNNYENLDDDVIAEVNNMIVTKMDSVTQQNKWLSYSTQTQKIGLMLNSYITGQNPSFGIDLFATWFEYLPIDAAKKFVSDILNIDTLTSIFNLIAPILPASLKTTTSKNLFETSAVNTFKDKLLRYLTALEKSRKGGFDKIKIFLINQHVFGKSGFIPFDKVDLPRLKMLYGDEKDLSPAERLKLYCKSGQFKKARPLIAEIDDFYPFLIIALNRLQAQFVIDLLTEISKRDKDIFTIIPQDLTQQEKLLRSVAHLALHHLQLGKTIFTKMMDYKPWNRRLLSSIADDSEDTDIKNLLLQKKPKLTNTPPDNNNTTPPSVANSSIACSSVLFPPITLYSNNPLQKLEIFTEEKCTGEEANAQCYAIVMVLIQFFQAYYLTKNNNVIPGLSYDDSRRIRNALVHQQVQDPANSGAYLLLDGEADNLIHFTNLLINAVKTRNSTAFLANPLFAKILQHGNVLATQKKRGEREQVMFYQRLLYTRWLNKTSASFENLKTKESMPLPMLVHAKAALSILKQLYCLKESGCLQADLEHAQAKAIRHLNSRLPLVSVQPNNKLGLRRAV